MISGKRYIHYFSGFCTTEIVKWLATSEVITQERVFALRRMPIKSVTLEKYQVIH